MRSLNLVSGYPNSATSNKPQNSPMEKSEKAQALSHACLTLDQVGWESIRNELVVFFFNTLWFRLKFYLALSEQDFFSDVLFTRRVKKIKIPSAIRIF